MGKAGSSRKGMNAGVQDGRNTAWEECSRAGGQEGRRDLEP